MATKRLEIVKLSDYSFVPLEAVSKALDIEGEQAEKECEEGLQR